MQKKKSEKRKRLLLHRNQFSEPIIQFKFLYACFLLSNPFSWNYAHLFTAARSPSMDSFSTGMGVGRGCWEEGGSMCPQYPKYLTRRNMMLMDSSSPSHRDLLGVLFRFANMLLLFGISPLICKSTLHLILPHTACFTCV